jgi:hypothetical protein
MTPEEFQNTATEQNALTQQAAACGGGFAVIAALISFAYYYFALDSFWGAAFGILMNWYWFLLIAVAGGIFALIIFRATQKKR